MEQSDAKKTVFQVTCPHCQTVLWVDGRAGLVVKTEKAAKGKGSLDDLLQKEQKRRSEFESKFEATAELERQKKEKAKEKFAKALENVDKPED